MYSIEQQTSRPANGQTLRLVERRDVVDRPQVDVEIVIPVYNEERSLSASVRRLHRYLTAEMPPRWRITIADNASSDATPQIARTLTQDLQGVDFIRLERKGRGLALRSAWGTTRARVYAYMDVDLSTDLRALMPLVAPLLSGHSEISIGTRLAPGSRVVRAAKREFISRSYNHLLRSVLRAKFSDAQCGFKAVRGDVAGELLDQVTDNGWFFDTELLIVAQRKGMRIHEVAVDWVDDPDSSVRVVKTALDDLRGVARLASTSRLVRFMAVGIASTLAYAGLFLALAPLLGSVVANFAALTVTAVANTAVNRRVTFGVRGRHRLFSDHLAGLTVFAVALALTSLSLSVLHGIVSGPSHLLEASVLVTANLCATLMRYATLSSLLFARRSADGAAGLPTVRHVGELSKQP